jgi:hypothetical protein
MKGPVMVIQPTSTNRKKGRFIKGRSGNPAGRPKGSTSHAADLRRLEEDALKLASNTAEVIAETARSALKEIELPELIPLFDAICNSAKDAVRDGEIGPSSVAMLRGWYDDHLESGTGGNFFAHISLPKNCSWEVFKEHYTHRGRINHKRHADDLRTFPPIAKAIKDAA